MKLSFLTIFWGRGAGIWTFMAGDFCGPSGLPQLGGVLVRLFFKRVPDLIKNTSSQNPYLHPICKKLCLYDQKCDIGPIGSLFKVPNPVNTRRSDNVLWPFSERSGRSDNVQWTFNERLWLSGKQLIKKWNFQHFFVVENFSFWWVVSHYQNVVCYQDWAL